MYTSEHIGALQRAGIPLKRTINEGDYYQWPGGIARSGGDRLRWLSLSTAMQ